MWLNIKKQQQRKLNLITNIKYYYKIIFLGFKLFFTYLKRKK